VDNSVKRYNGYTGAYLDEYVIGGSPIANITFSPSGKAYVSTANRIHERQPDGSLVQYVTTPGTSVYRMAWGADNTGDGKDDLYLTTNSWDTGVYLFGAKDAAGVHFAPPPSGYHLYEAFCFGPDKTGYGMPEIFGQGQYAGLQVAYHDGDTGAYIGYLTGSIGAYAADMLWGPDDKLYIANKSQGNVKVYTDAGVSDYSFWVAGTTPTANKAYALDVVPIPASPYGSISGRITLQDYSGDLQYVLVKAQLRNPGETTAVRTVKLLLDSQGNYTIADIIPGTYDLAFKASSWLQQVVPNVQAVIYQTTRGVDVSLPNGDLDGSNEVTAEGDVPVLLENMDISGAK